jgi:lipopolysaccharide transport system permease protein
MNRKHQLGTEDVANGGRAWKLVIRPRSSWLDLHLKDLWTYRDLVLMFVRRDFVSQFKQTVLGPTWFVLQPLLTTVVFVIVFGHIASLSTDGIPKTLFYLSGNVVWMYFAGVLTATSNTFVGNANLFGKVYFPRLAVPLSIVISSILKFGLQFLLFLAFLLFFWLNGAPVHLTPYAALFPVLILIMAGLALGLGILFSSMTTKYRDLRFLLEFGVRLLMYATPVVFPLSSIPGKWRWFLMVNPMTPVIETFRLGFLGQGTFSWLHLGYSLVFAVASLLVGVTIFNRVERTFMDTV